MQKILSKFLSVFTVLSMLVMPLASLPIRAFAAAPSDFPAGDFPTTGYTSLGTDPNENGCKAHRNVLESYFKIVPNTNGTDNFVFLRVRTTDPAGWPSNNSNGDAHYKWFFDTTGNDGKLQGGNILNYEYLLGVQDPGGNANDGIGQVSFYDSNETLLGGPVTGTGSIAPSGPQTAYANNFGYKVEGNNVDMYLRLSAIGTPSNFKVFWSTDNEDPNLDSSSNCDRPETTDTFISLPTFTLTVNGAGAGSGNVTGTGITCAVAAGVTSGDCTETFITGTTVNLNQSAAVGSDFSDWSGNCDVNGQVVVSANKTCTATFVLEPPATLTLTKTVDNSTTGGTATDANFQAKIDGNNVAWGTPVEVSPGVHTASEVNLPGYTPSSWGSDCAANGTVTLSAGQNKTCTITNTAQQAYVVVNVSVANDNGGTADENDFLPTVDGSGVTDEASNPVNPGTYPVSYTNLAGYTASSWGGDCIGGNVTAVLGQTKTCTITFSDDAPSIKVVKTVTNDNGGSATETSFSFLLDNTLSLIHNIASTTTAGAHNISEGLFSGYTASNWGGDCNTNGSITISLGQNATCTITNDDNQAKLTVIKNVIKNDGGNANANDFQIYVKNNSNNNVANSPAAGSESGTVYMLDAGNYTVSEDEVDGYVGSINGNCASNGTITLLPGDDRTCTITNDDIGAGLTIQKIVTNDNGGDANEDGSDFQGYINGLPVNWNDTQEDLIANTPYTLTEDNLPGYAPSSWSCDGGTLIDNEVTITEGETVICTITNDDIAPSLTLVKEVVNDNGGTAVAGAWTLTATGYDSESPDAGTYNLGESGGPTGYTQTSLTCSNSEGQVTSVTLALDEDVTCTFVNNDNVPSLTLTKNVVGGDADEEDWTLSATGNNDFLLEGTSPVVSGSLFPAGTYTLSESTGPENYNPASFWQCEGGNMNETTNQITLELGESAECSITNTYVPVVYECSDGIDTEGEADELADENDPGCHTDRDVNNTGSYDPFDDDESNVATECSDGVNNNDVDNLVDSNDPACHTDSDPSDEDEISSYNPDDTDEATECSDDADNSDGEDELSDANDPGCHTDGDATDEDDTYNPNDTSESNDALPQCNDDNNNNDNDDLIDANDPDCHTDGDANNEGSYDPSDDNEDGEEDNSARSSGGSRRSPQGQVLGAATEICNVVDTYMRRGYRNVADEVETLQNFLNGYMQSGLTVDSMFGPMTEAAVKAFQLRQRANVMVPWGLTAPTGIFYKTSLAEAKRLMCPDEFGNLPIPTDLIPWSKNGAQVPPLAR